VIAPLYFTAGILATLAAAGIVGLVVLRHAARRWDEIEAARQRHPTTGPRTCPPRPRKGAWKDTCK
jgi:hypothetical protein